MIVDDLRRAREENANVAYMTFMKHIRQDKDGLFCFFEGNDAPYYQVQIRRIYQDNYYPISCGNKAKVLKVYQLINYHRIYDKYKKGFFIDRDFDPLENNPAIYETPCYSIENLYVSPTVFSEILKNELQLTEVSESYINAMNLYENLLYEFLEATILFNAWYACQVDWKHENKEKLLFSLGEKPLKGFINTSLENIQVNYDVEKIKNRFKKAVEISEETLNQKIEIFKDVDKRFVFRGKFGFKFMMEVLEKLVDNSRKAKTIMTAKVNYNITQSQGISQFAQYAETPESLTEYLGRILN